MFGNIKTINMEVITRARVISSRICALILPNRIKC